MDLETLVPPPPTKPRMRCRFVGGPLDGKVYYFDWAEGHRYHKVIIMPGEADDHQATWRVRNRYEHVGRGRYEYRPPVVKKPKKK